MAEKNEKLLLLLNGGGPWGFRLTGGAGTGLPLIVSKVRRKSKSYKKLFEGDLILSINDQSCKNLTYDQVMEIADNCGIDLTLEVLRKESNKENAVRPHNTSSDMDLRTTSRPLKMVENGATTKELISMSEKTTKITEEKEDLRIKSATLLPDVISFPADQKVVEKQNGQNLCSDLDVPLTVSPEKKNVQPFVPHNGSDQTTTVFSSPNFDTSTCSKMEEVSKDEHKYVKTTTETKHEVKGNTETSFTKKESVSKSTNGNVTADAIDLNNLINATQKRLESFKNGLKTEPITESTSIYEEKKIETTNISKTETSQLFDSNQSMPFSTPILDSTYLTSSNEQRTDSEKKVPPPVASKPKSKKSGDSLSSKFADCLKEIESDIAALNGSLGFSSQESSTVTTDFPFGSETIIKKKKMFSSSSFYEEPGSLYPTVEEQVEMARKIADSLAADTNKKSKGANMFNKRVKKSSKWIHEGPDLSDESAPLTPEVEPPTPDPSQIPFRPSQGPPKLKLILDPRHPFDATALRSSGLVINQHNVVSPDICHGLVKDLHSPIGKGAALFAKRKKKSEEWVVDEEKVKALLKEHEKRVIPTPPIYSNQYSTYSRPDVKLVKTPWDAAMESPFGLCDAAFARVHPDQLADTVIRAAESKRATNPTSPPPLQDIYAKAPRGWTPTNDPPSFPTQEVWNTSQSQPAYDNRGSLKKSTFQNFNTVPRLWKGGNAY